MKIISVVLNVAVILGSTQSLAFAESTDEQVVNFFKANKSDEMLSDVVNTKFIPPYQSDKVFKAGVRMCRNKIFSDSYKLGAAKILARNEFLGHAANSNSVIENFINNSGGIDQLFNLVEYDVVRLETYRNDKSSRQAANTLWDKDTDSPQTKKVLKWLENLKGKGEETEIGVFMFCLKMELINTLLKEGDGLFKEELRTVSFQVHNQESGRTKTLLSN